MSTSDLILRLPANIKGRCFVVTDVHFQVKKLMEGLGLLGFDPSVDRLIIAGDLLDRGPDMREALALLDKSYVFLVRGNHEQMIIDAWKEKRAYGSNGAGWWMTLEEESQDMVAKKLDSLPYIIEIECSEGVVGVVHANVPSGLSWPEFVERISYQGIKDRAIWERERVIRHQLSGVDGVWRVCIGHTYLAFPQRLDNVLALDCTTGNGAALAIYCVQEDTIYVNGKPALFEDLTHLKADAISRHLDSPSELDHVMTKLSKLEVDVHLLLEMNNALMGLMFEKKSDRLEYVTYLRKRFRGSAIEPMLSNLLSLVATDSFAA